MKVNQLYLLLLRFQVLSQLIGSKEYFEILFDENQFKEFNAELKSKDFLKFEDSKKYIERLKDAHKKTGLYDAIKN